jgi:cell surface protein SprA
VQPDQVVGVAFEYTYNGIAYKIGEFSSDLANTDSASLRTNVLFVKMLKSTTANVRFPIWDLMMKNVYSVGTANVDPQEFRFDIFYEDPGKGQKRFLNGDDIPPAFPAFRCSRFSGSITSTCKATPAPTVSSTLCPA